MTDRAGVSRRQKVWDAPTRLFHWLIVGLVAFSWWCADVGERMDWHVWSGLAVVGLLVFRLWWGFAGPATARFSHFLKGPGAVFGYAGKLFGRDYKATFGHNPLGGISVVAILLVLIAQVGLGLFALDSDQLHSGPFTHLIGYELAEQITDLHAIMFNVLLVLIGLHIAAIAFYLVVKRINLVGPMITGARKATGEGPAEGIERVPLWRFLVGVALAAGAVWLIAR